MNIPERTFVDILDENVKYDNVTVPVIVVKRFKDSTPCITIDTLTSHYDSPRYSETLLLPLNESHPQYDKDNPNKKFAQEVVTQEQELVLQVNVWSNTEEQRQSIVKQVKELINKAINFHYTTCSNYEISTQNCKGLNETCKCINNNYSRAMKGLCPDPQTYGYESIFKKNNIKHGSIDLYSEFDLDDYTTDQIILRTVLKIRLIYYDHYNRGGNEATEINVIDWP